LGLAVTLGAIAFAVVLAQPPAPQPPPTFRTEANYVRVDAYPTKDEAPVTDLTQSDFEILESGTPQKIEQFERVVIQSAGPQDTRMEPNTVRESLAMAQNSRARLVVLFLDTYHVEVDGSRRIRKPLVDALDRLIGTDDLVAVMTPEMSATDITFARKTTTIDGILTRYWHWGDRDKMNLVDPVDRAYIECYPNVPPNADCADQNGIAAEMLDRRHEKLVLDALEDLVGYLHGVREERKAILAISDGWLLFRPNETLARPLKCEGVPTGPKVSIDPRSGRLTTKDPNDGSPPSRQCQTDRMRLAQLDNDRQFRDLLDAANRANASFYPIDPRGLAVFDTQLMRLDVPGPPPPVVPPSVDQAMLRGRINSLQTLAEATDGLAIVNSNNLAAGLKRVVDDLSSYYLIGYYSSGRLDGKFHPISVRVKRPGVRVRARRGYLAATPATAALLTRAAAGKGPSAPEPAESAALHAVEAAIAPLAGYTRDVPLRLQMAAGWKPGDNASAAMWIVGELGGVALLGDAWNDGFDASVTLTTPSDASVATGRMSVSRGVRVFRLAVTPAQPLVPGEYIVRVGARAGPASIPSRETARLSVPAAPEAVGALFVRRGASTGIRTCPPPICDSAGTNRSASRFRRRRASRRRPPPRPRREGTRVPVTAAVATMPTAPDGSAQLARPSRRRTMPWN
jgi:VWFA-related protein